MLTRVDQATTDEGPVRAQLALLHARFSTKPADLQEALEALDTAFDAAARALPRRTPELHLLRADLLARLDRHDEATTAADTARQLIEADQTDDRARHCWRDWQKDHAAGEEE